MTCAQTCTILRARCNENGLLVNLNGLNLSQDDTFVCRDVALDDEAAANLALQCRLKTI